ncbi:hypothetical protein [Actinomycetospora termitidis]|uniref:Uncharacterized protein n=1 Tax=Actinomycetospora termitidis TaxID=3053470 RepID=A0ABT7M292_9PSEU|nr:hypothetical protein [Actinomycetospora sp. Odt1-22]MDL5154541.1 hypothetical protein [Actinomycetospora sp. Odt1-22]
MSGGHELLEHVVVDLLWKVGIVATLAVLVALACWRISARPRSATSRSGRGGQ